MKNNNYKKNINFIAKKDLIREKFDILSFISILFVIIAFIGYIIINVYSYFYFKDQDLSIQSGGILFFFLSTIIYGAISVYYILIFIISILLKKLESKAKLIKNIILSFFLFIPILILVLYLFFNL